MFQEDNRDGEQQHSPPVPAPRLLCIAGNFTKYDEHAVQQIDRDISLIRYKRFGEDLVVLELVNAPTAPPTARGRVPDTAARTWGPIMTPGLAHPPTRAIRISPIGSRP